MGLDFIVTSDGILLSDWEMVQALAADYANAVVKNPRDEAATRLRKKMLRLLNRLCEKYGKRPGILATKADYLASDRRRAKLLEEAYILAEKIHDFRNKTFVASSLAELYVEEMVNTEIGVLWVERLGDALLDYFDETEQGVFYRLKAIIERLDGAGSN